MGGSYPKRFNRRLVRSDTHFGNIILRKLWMDELKGLYSDIRKASQDVPAIIQAENKEIGMKGRRRQIV